MKGKIIIAAALVLMASCGQKESNDGVMSRNGKVYTINTTTLCDARGYRGPTPVTVTVKKNKIVSIEALPNNETPRFFENVKRNMFPKYQDLKFKDHASVDAISGATLSSNAVKKNVEAAYNYYIEHK